MNFYEREISAETMAAMASVYAHLLDKIEMDHLTVKGIKTFICTMITNMTGDLAKKDRQLYMDVMDGIRSDLPLAHACVTEFARSHVSDEDMEKLKELAKTVNVRDMDLDEFAKHFGMKGFREA